MPELCMLLSNYKTMKLLTYMTKQNTKKSKFKTKGVKEYDMHLGTHSKVKHLSSKK